MFPRTITLAMVLLCSACLPIPERIYDTPAIRGRLTGLDPARPAPQLALVDLRRGATCRSPLAEATVDSTGHFAFSARRHLVPYFLLLPAHQLQDWQLCLRDSTGASQPLSRGFFYGMGGGIRQVALECDAVRAAAAGGAVPDTLPARDLLSGEGACRFAAAPKE